MIWTVFIAGAYLLGSVSFSYLAVRWRLGRDIRTLGSGNAGATNVLRTTGKLPALAVLLLDVGKGLVPVLLVRAEDGPGWVQGAVAAAVVTGHIFPVFHGFRGGKGVATAAGAMFPLAPLPALCSLGVFVLVAATTRQVAIASISAIGLFPFWLHLCAWLGWSADPPPWLQVTGLGVALLIVAKHWDNIERLRAGTEWKLGDPRDE